MEICVIGAGRIDVTEEPGSLEIKDPFLHLCNALKPHFDEVSVEINTPTGPVDPEVVSQQFAGIRVRLTSSYSSFLQYFTNLKNLRPSKLRQLSRVIRSSDVVVLRLPGPVAFPASLVCRMTRKPFLLFVASDLHEIAQNLRKSDSWKTRLKGRIVSMLSWTIKKRMVPRAARRLYLSEKMKENYGDQGHPKAGVFTTSIVTKVHPTTKASFQDRPIRLIFISRIVAEKGLSTLVDIIAGLHANGHRLAVDIVGDGREKCELETRLGQLQDQQLEVQYHGWVSDRTKLEALLLDADFCLLPSHNEGTPKIIFEAMATHTIFMGTRVGGIPDVVIDGVDGLLFDRGDAAEAMRKINACIDRPVLVDEINDKAARKADNFTLEATAAKLAGSIRDCAKIAAS